MPFISDREYEYLQLCKRTLYDHYRVRGLCPNCHKAIIFDGYLCENCRYDIDLHKVIEK